MKSALKILPIIGILLLGFLLWQESFYQIPQQTIAYKTKLTINSGIQTIRKETNKFLSDIKDELSGQTPLKGNKKHKNNRRIAQIQEKRSTRKSIRPQRRGFIDLRPYRMRKLAKNGNTVSDIDQARHAFLVTHLGMTDLEADAFQYVNRRYAEKISAILVKRDPKGLNTDSVKKIIKIDDQRDEWLRKRLGQNRYQLFVEFEEDQFFKGASSIDRVSQNF